jgi:hypothetical protein
VIRSGWRINHAPWWRFLWTKEREDTPLGRGDDRSDSLESWTSLQRVRVSCGLECSFLPIRSDGMYTPGLTYPPLVVDKRTGELTVHVGVDWDHAAALGLALFKDHMLNEMLWGTGELKRPTYWREAGNVYEVFTHEFTELLGESSW